MEIPSLKSQESWGSFRFPPDAKEEFLVKRLPVWPNLITYIDVQYNISL